MNEESVLTFSLNLARGDTDCIDIFWPVVHSTEKALLVETEGGQIWIPKFKLANIYRNGEGKYVLRRDDLIKLIDEVTSTGTDTLHRVWKSGRGKTEKSHKYKIAVARTLENQLENETVIVRRTFTLPISQIKTDESGKCLAPRWLILKHLLENERLPRVAWQGLAKVTREIDNAVAELTASVERARQERQAAKLKAEHEKQAALVALKQRVDVIRVDAPLALKFCKSQYTLEVMREMGVNMSYWPTWDDSIQDTWLVQWFEKIVAVAHAHPNFTKWRERQMKKLATCEQS